MPRHHPFDALAYPRFEGISTFMRLPHTQDLTEVDVAIVGVPFDTGASYRTGQRFGPQAVRAGSRLLRPYDAVLNVGIFDHLSVVDFGDLPVVPGNVEATYDRVVEGLMPIHAAGVTPIVIGGDHSIVLGELRAAAAVHGPLGLAHFDSHSDTWDAYWGQKYTHGTPFRRAVEEGLLDPARCIQVGMRGPVYDAEDMRVPVELGFTVITSEEMTALGVDAVASKVHQIVAGGPAFLSFDVDFIDPASCPGTGTPEIGGPTTREVLSLLRRLQGLNVVAFDVVEVLPDLDVAEITAMTAANVAYTFMALLALRRAERSAPSD
jgi:agmatinase